MIETKWQTEICKVLNRHPDSYYAKKWASPDMNIGVPDLIIGSSGGFVRFTEVKRVVVSDLERFRRTVKISPKQQVELNRLAQAGLWAQVLVIVEKEGGTKGSTLLQTWRFHHWPMEFVVSGADNYVMWRFFEQSSAPLSCLYRQINDG